MAAVPSLKVQQWQRHWWPQHWHPLWQRGSKVKSGEWKSIWLCELQLKGPVAIQQYPALRGDTSVTGGRERKGKEADKKEHRYLLSAPEFSQRTIQNLWDSLTWGPPLQACHTPKALRSKHILHPTLFPAFYFSFFFFWKLPNTAIRIYGEKKSKNVCYSVTCWETIERPLIANLLDC